MRILLAEDEAALRHALTVLLERNCYTVDAVDNGRDALEYLRTGDYGCAVLDVMMPKLDGFSVVRQLRQEKNPVPVLRTAEYPGAFSSHSEQELQSNTKETVFPQVVKALTEPITEEEIAQYANDGKRPYDEIVYYGNFDEIQEFVQVNGWSDGLPVVPPTDEKIREYLHFTPYGAGEILGTYALAYRECSVYTVAANAVMAGVPKEFMPICIAFTQCLENGSWASVRRMAQPAFGSSARPPTPGSLPIKNKRIGDQIGHRFFIHRRGGVLRLAAQKTGPAPGWEAAEDWWSAPAYS